MPAIPSPNNLSSNPPPLPASSPTIRDASTPLPETLVAVAPRAAATTAGFVAIPTTYGSLYSSPSPGTIVGIVLGSVGGFLFLLFFLYACLGCGGAAPFALILGRGGVEVEEDDVEEEVEVRRGRSGKKRHRRHHRPRTAETVEVRTTRERVVREEGPPPVVVVEPRRPPPQPAPPPPRVVPDDDSEDEVIVYEEEESEREAPRRRSRRSTSRRSDERSRRASGYRPVDPQRYGGGDASMRDVPRRSGSRRDRDY